MHHVVTVVAVYTPVVFLIGGLAMPVVNPEMNIHEIAHSFTCLSAVSAGFYFGSRIDVLKQRHPRIPAFLACGATLGYVEAVQQDGCIAEFMVAITTVTTVLGIMLFVPSEMRRKTFDEWQLSIFVDTIIVVCLFWALFLVRRGNLDESHLPAMTVGGIVMHLAVHSVDHWRAHREHK